MKKTFAIYLLAAAAVLCAGESELARNKRLLAERKALNDQIVEEKTQISSKEKTNKILRITADLINGKLQTPPKKVENWKQVFQFETEKPCTITRSESDKKSRCTERWMTLESGKRYRFEADVKLDNVRETKNVKFGLMVPTNGVTQWPAAEMGAGTFDWRTASFEYTLPQTSSGKSSVLLLYGIEGGFGTMYVRNVRVLAQE